MMSLRALLLTTCLALSAAGAAMAQGPFTFTDVTEPLGLMKHLKGWAYGHGAAWGDVNGDGRPDLYAGAFADRPIFNETGPLPNMLLLNNPGGFALSDQKDIEFIGQHAAAAMELFVDLDNDGDLDLVAGNYADRPSRPDGHLFENTGGGKFRDATPLDVWPKRSAMRNVSAVDFNGDGLLDLLLAENSRTGRLMILENKGSWKFQDVSAKYGLPDGNTDGLGLAVGDINNDGVFDIFVAGCNRLFVSDPNGVYRECKFPDGMFPRSHGEYMPCGAAFGDLNGDGLLDLVVTVHAEPGVIFAYLNKGIRDGMPQLEQIYKWTLPLKGTTGLPVKAAHVALADMDNDGRRDVYVAAIYANAQGKYQPLVLKNTGNKDGIPQFLLPPMDRMVGYYAPGPVADYDRDGRMDIFLPTWFEELPSILFHNDTPGGHWLAVRVAGKGPGRNPMGIGAIVRVYQAGKGGDPSALLGRWDISVGNGYASGEEAIAYFGLGAADKCDVEVRWGKQLVTQAGVPANQYLTVTVEAK